MTSRKARFVPVAGGGLQAAESTKTKEVNGLFDLMHALNGNFFNGRPTEHENAKELKAAALQARGEQGHLMSAEDFFRKYAL